MLRYLVGAAALAVCLSSIAADAREPRLSARSLPMNFEWWQDGPADVCGDRCRTWISAVGTITAETPREFETFAKQRDVRGATLALDSGGGSVHGAMALGRLIRKHGIATTIGRTIVLSGEADDSKRRARLSPHADCESMCVFVLLGGATREVPLEARLMVHQIWLGDRRDDAVAAHYSAEDLVLVQRDIGRLAIYTVEMGGAIELLDLSLRIPPWEPMRSLTRNEMRRTHLIQGDGIDLPQPPAVASAAATNAAVLSGLPLREAKLPRGWNLIEASGEPMLTRRHPLTLEGVEIGTFEVAVTCSADPEQYHISYNERRRIDGPGKPLKAVTMSLGSRSARLNVLTSEPVSRASELSTFARGSVPASLMRSFAHSPRRALVISTHDGRDGRTAIRVGNSGIPLAFSRLIARCNGGARNAAHADLTRGQVR